MNLVRDIGAVFQGDPASTTWHVWDTACASLLTALNFGRQGHGKVTIHASGLGYAIKISGRTFAKGTTPKELHQNFQAAVAKLRSQATAPAAPCFYVRFAAVANSTLAGKYLSGPRSAEEVRARGYGVTEKIEEAWPFTSRRQAENKARIVMRHFSMTAAWVEVTEQNTSKTNL